MLAIKYELFCTNLPSNTLIVMEVFQHKSIIHCVRSTVGKPHFQWNFGCWKTAGWFHALKKKQQNQNGFGKCILKAPHGKWFCNYWPDTILLFSHFALHKKVSIIAGFHLITRQYRGCVWILLTIATYKIF